MLSSGERTAVQFVVRHAGMGIGAGALFGIAMLASDFAELRSLAFTTDILWLAIALLLFGLLVTFGTVSLAASLMLLGRTDDGSRDDSR